MKKLLKTYGFTRESEFYHMLYSSFINGQKNDVREWFKQMPKENRKDFVKYAFALNDQEFNEVTEWFFDLL
jgi:hypothetical protein